MNKNDLKEYFTYHKPDEGQITAMQKIREKALELADLMDGLVADCADKSAAVRHLREAVMSVNAAIVLQGKVTGYSVPRARGQGPSFEVRS